MTEAVHVTDAGHVGCAGHLDDVVDRPLELADRRPDPPPA